MDAAVAATLVEKAKAKNISIVFLNREPSVDILKSYDKTWCFGVSATQSEILFSQLIAKHFK